MKRFSIRTLLVVVTLAAVVAWQYGAGYRKVFSEDSPQHGKLEIFGFEEERKHKVRIRFMPVGGGPEDVHKSAALVFHKPLKGRLSFHSVVDQATGNWFVCDENNAGLVVMLLKSPNRMPGEFEQGWHRVVGRRVIFLCADAGQSLYFNNLLAEEAAFDAANRVVDWAFLVEHANTRSV